MLNLARIAQDFLVQIFDAKLGMNCAIYSDTKMNCKKYSGAKYLSCTPQNPRNVRDGAKQIKEPTHMTQLRDKM